MLRDHGDVAPSVIGAGYVTPADEEEDLPETAYIPCQRVTKGATDVIVEMRDTTDGQRALLAFTSLQELVDSCGDGQPWVAVPGRADR
ncbi:SAV_915 family protein [Saccharopolyspora hattusasensis]|uniref:SAV_915 family protein n=1 Tax=Saccharopolyspora hattusasensis TaxID=1128679 RepID=UPI003D96B9FD